MALPVQLVVGEFEFVEVDDSIHPVGTRAGGVRVNIEPGGGTLLLETLHPRGVLVLVSIFVHRCHVHEQNVRGIGIQVKQLKF